MADLQLTDQIAANGQYTFLFNSSGNVGWHFFGFKASAAEVVTKILGAGLPITDVNASYQGGVIGLFSSLLRVTFRWTQAGWSAKQVIQNLEAAATETESTFTYVSGVGGWPSSTIADDVKNQIGEGTGQGDSSFAGTSSSSFGMLALLGIVVFALFVGIASFSRGLSERV